MIRDICCGKNLRLLQKQPNNYFSSIVTDAPYGLNILQDPAKVLKDWLRKGHHEPAAAGGFMGASWDRMVPSPRFWKSALRVTRPGGHCLCFFHARTYHWGVLALQLAGWEIRDQLQWIHSQGFPKSHSPRLWMKGDQDDARWAGYGTALKPAFEPIVLARKPLEGTIEQTWRKYGTGLLAIDDCRIPFQGPADFQGATFGTGIDITGGHFGAGQGAANGRRNIEADPTGRWPANILLDEWAASQLDRQTGHLVSGKPGIHGEKEDPRVFHSESRPAGTAMTGYGDQGGASRFFYVAKPSHKERDAGLQEGEENKHFTVKPIGLMRYLAKLVTPPGGILLDPFAGSGTTGCASEMEGIPYVLMEQSRTDCQVAQARCRHWAIRHLEERGQYSLFPDL